MPPCKTKDSQRLLLHSSPCLHPSPVCYCFVACLSTSLIYWPLIRWRRLFILLAKWCIATDYVCLLLVCIITKHETCFRLQREEDHQPTNGPLRYSWSVVNLANANHSPSSRSLAFRPVLFSDSSLAFFVQRLRVELTACLPNHRLHYPIAGLGSCSAAPPTALWCDNV